MKTLPYQRILIIGNNGSGKSFLGKKLAETSDLPLIHLDAEYWQAETFAKVCHVSAVRRNSTTESADISSKIGKLSRSAFQRNAPQDGILQRSQADGTHPAKDAWQTRVQELITEERWIIEGHYASTLAQRYARADLVIFLDISRLVCLAGIMRRFSKNRPDMPYRGADQINAAFFRFLYAAWRFDRERKPQVMQLHRQYPEITLWILKNRRKIKQLIEHYKAA
ncbi:MAG: hypothetical protein Q4G42_05615 [Neisseria sp.]|nr:hypothetical protein [Neisseria sp.]